MGAGVHGESGVFMVLRAVLHEWDMEFVALSRGCTGHRLWVAIVRKWE
jgi:hypothetical protein